MHYVYHIESQANPRKRYIGYTRDLPSRIEDHNTGKNVSTASDQPWALTTYFAFATKKPALDFERNWKSGSGHAFAHKRLW